MLGQLDDMLANNPQQVAKLIEKELARVEPSQRQQIIRALPQSVVLSLPAAYVSQQ
jgi:putative heme iron utilization protein